MRVLTYIFVGAGAAIAIIALAVTLLDTGEQATIEPQTDASPATNSAPQASPSDAPTTGQEATASGDLDAPADGSSTASPTDGTATDDNPASAAATTGISIDLAQVRPDGNAVVAGKAVPHANITVFEGDVILGRTKADENGEWVIVPEAALGAGEHLVSVGAVAEDGTSSVADVTMAIQIGETQDDQPLVALLPQTETDIPKLLQSPDDTPVTPVPQTGEQSNAQSNAQSGADKPVLPAVAPRSLSWKAGGELVVAGASRGGLHVDVTAGGNPFGTGRVDDEGGWQVAGRVDMTRPSRMMLFTLRDVTDAIIATYELPVATRDLSQGLDGSRMVIVQRGDALWRIAYSSYGEGIKYVDIVRRNAAAINDPDLIFPNQIFALPQKP
ncbi:MAG: LysM peptidoglycan-binding domain-containing protein [Pseudomonadota bacterium]|nr:LysM peptidoglycan-binding domain-containing protein [Pseudomonadota bacterium]